MAMLKRLRWAAGKAWTLFRAEAHARRHLADGKPVFVDIGARGGLQRKWHWMAQRGLVDAYVVEPDPDAAAALKAAGTPAKVIPLAFGETAGTARLNVLREPGCSSIREPDPAVVGKYGFASAFELVRTVDIELESMAAVVARGEMPAPDFAKIDVQGYEFEILKGAGAALDRLIGLEVELQFEPLYRGQPLFQATYDWLLARHFGLVALRPQSLLDHNMVEANAFFARAPQTLDARGRRLRDFWLLLNRIESGTDYSYSTW